MCTHAAEEILDKREYVRTVGGGLGGDYFYIKIFKLITNDVRIRHSKCQQLYTNMISG